MNYLDSLVNPMFKKSESGKTLFYPWGIFGKGHVLPSESQHARIRVVLKWYYVVMFLAMGTCINFLSSLHAAGCAVFGLGLYALWISLVTRRLRVSEERLRYSESVEQSLPYYSTWVLVVLSLFSFVGFLVGGFILYKEPAEWLMASLCLILFGVMTVLLVFMTMKKVRSKRRLES